ncbi:SipW-dependent-type signal peptide-containing protein [Prescottella equi]|nr:SipW-dependent-type signal peptide-containing protein [Prescottella equi]
MSRHVVPGSRPGFATRARATLTGSRTRAVASLGIVLGLGAIGTLAAWSDTAVATSGTFSTGSIDLKLNGNDGNPTAYSFATLTKAGMLPNDSVAATLPVQNLGTVPFTYTMSANSTTSGLAPYMRVTVTNGASNGSTCGGTAIASNVALVSGGSASIISAARSIGGSSSETLCFQVALDSSVPNNMQNQTVSTSFNFNATTA